MKEDCASVWEQTLNQIISQTEQSEWELAAGGSLNREAERKSSGSYYTPEDVADHFWLLFFRFHKIENLSDLRTLIKKTDFVEPSAGSGIFLFTFFRKALRFGLDISELADIRFHVVDINFSALKYVSEKLKHVEYAVGCELKNVGWVQHDFVNWIKDTSFDNVIFVGNPPYVSNPVGSKWRNLYANFVEAMLSQSAQSRSFSLILPISICFSRQYTELRDRLNRAGMGISIASYDNIPNALFKSGKPESSNTNKSNSQRCVILHAGGPDCKVRETTGLLRWTAAERSEFLARLPTHQCFSSYGFDDQFPRFVDEQIASYLSVQHDLTVRSLISETSAPTFSVAGAARNFIGIRNFCSESSGSTPIRAVSKEASFILLQLFGSPAFFAYWRSLGDGFHVTKRNLFDFPISEGLLESCKTNLPHALKTWRNREKYQKSKLNCGKLIETHDFSEAFRYIKI